jgi:hypothetical protein
MSEYEGKYAYVGVSDPRPNRYWKPTVRGKGFRCAYCLVYSELGMERRGIPVKLCLINCYSLPWVRRVAVLSALEDRASLGMGRELPPAGISGQTMRDLR